MKEEWKMVSVSVARIWIRIHHLLFRHRFFLCNCGANPWVLKTLVAFVREEKLGTHKARIGRMQL